MKQQIIEAHCFCWYFYKWVDSDCVPKYSDCVPKYSDCVPKYSDCVPKYTSNDYNILLIMHDMTRKFTRYSYI